ncbi:TRI17 ligase, partial [Bucorvus abyssinicus]|nr:TRI17 ligase [Bucorvus abyssinicus]
ARLLEVAKRLGLRAAGGETAAAEEEEEEEEGSERHQEPLKVFCKDDETFLCRVCRESRAHRAHEVLPVPEAVCQYKGEIEARLQVLKDTREKLLGSREVELRRSW